MTGKNDTLIRTFRSRNRRKPAGPLDQGFPKVPGGTLTFKPGKTSPVVDQKLYRSKLKRPS